jgi:TIR domain-containing protein
MAPDPSPPHGGFAFDVAFSYAGEDRAYVEQVRSSIGDRLRVFYDHEAQVDLWGKSLTTQLAWIYARKSRFCVIFISRHYVRKVWTRQERASAQTRASSVQQLYILPARFDDTTLPSVLPAVGEIDLRQMTPEVFADLLVEKVRSQSRARRPVRRRRGIVAKWISLVAAVICLVVAIGLVVPPAFAKPAPAPPPDVVAAAPMASPEVPPQAEPKQASPPVRTKCQKRCGASTKPCGGGCISAWKHCTKPPGIACRAD